MSERFGMMDNAYFTSKSDILKWINQTLELNVTKVEQACTGAIYCQLLDVCFPGKVKLHKVKWNAKNEVEFWHNLKILQEAITTWKIAKEINIGKLAKGKYIDNFEILQWFKGFFDNRAPELSTYNAPERRNHAKWTYLNEENLNKNKSVNPGRQQATHVRNFSKNSDNSTMSSNNSNNGNKVLKWPKQRPVTQELTKGGWNSMIDNINITPIDKIEEKSEKEFAIEIEKIDYDTLTEEIEDKVKEKYNEELISLKEDAFKNKREINTWKLLLADVGKDKDFYFKKLRDIEFLTVNPTNCTKEVWVTLIKSILYSEKETEVIIDENDTPNWKEKV